jgi:hypothetical protein
MTDDETPRRRRESIMSRSLRKARGEALDDDDFDDVLVDDDDDAYGPAPPRRVGPGGPVLVGGGGCSQGASYTILLIFSVVIIVFLFWSLLGSRFNPLQGLLPNVPAMFASPTPTIDTSRAAVIKRVQALNRLEASSYTVEKVIEAGVQGNMFQNLLFGDRLLLIANGTVVAGFDLSTLSEEDVTISEDGSTIVFHMPPPQVFDVSLDNNQTRVYDRQQGLLAAADKDLESQARQAAEAEILRSACEGGLMQRATADGQQAIEQLLHMVDFQQIEVIAAPVPPCPDYATLKSTAP